MLFLIDPNAADAVLPTPPKTLPMPLLSPLNDVSDFAALAMLVFVFDANVLMLAPARSKKLLLFLTSVFSSSVPSAASFALSAAASNLSARLPVVFDSFCSVLSRFFASPSASFS